MKYMNNTSNKFNAGIMNIMNNIEKAYDNVSHLFHEYYMNEFTMYSNIKRKRMSKDLISRMHEMIDECIKYRLGLNVKYPNKHDVLYSFWNPNEVYEDVDAVFDKLLNVTIPLKLAEALKNSMENYIKDENIIFCVLERMEM